MHERLKAARKYLKLSQEFVARQMKLSQLTISAIESGQRKITAQELDKFSELYGISAGELRHGKKSDMDETEMYVQAFSKLSEIDKKEIMNLIGFKRRYKESLNADKRVSVACNKNSSLRICQRTFYLLFSLSFHFWN